jgi:limonene-1,2-epoxide hydrolase
MKDRSEENEDVIRRFVEAWSRLDAKELSSFFTVDGIYHNMPIAPIVGREKVEEFIVGFSSSWTETTWDLLNISSRGNVVFAERLDRTRSGDKSVDLPCVGGFELEDGKIKVWRDYFDFATYGNAMA